MAQRIIAAINRFNEAMGQFAKWFIAFVVVIVCFDVFMRYFLNSPTLWGYDASYMVGCAFYTLGLGYAQKHEGNIRVDLLYGYFSPRAKVLLDTLMTLFFFLPTYILLNQKLYENAIDSIANGEKATTSTWYPYVGPVKLCIAIGFSLLVLQLGSDVLQGIFKLKTDLRKNPRNGQ